MSTIDKYGIQYGTGELFPQDNPGGTTDPTAVTKRRAKGNPNSFVSGGSTAVPEDPTAGLGQDLLNAIQMGNLGTGSGVYGRRESNTFYFKSLTAGAGISLSSTADTIIITSTGGGGSGPGTVIVESTDSIELSGDGLNTPLTADVLISGDADNGLELRADGLYAVMGEVGPTGPQGPQGPAGPTGPQGPAGEDGLDGTSLQFKGALDDVSELPPTGNVEGDAWMVDSHVWIWTNGAWADGGEIAGPAGPAGPAGADGADGADGNDGAQGPQGIQGPVGPAGPQGPPGETPDTLWLHKSVGGASYTLTYTSASVNDDKNVIEFTNTAAKSVTIPTHATNGFPYASPETSTMYLLNAADTGDLTIAPALGVTLKMASGMSLTVAPWEIVRIYKVAINTWYVSKASGSASGGGATTFLGLTDTPANYTGAGTRVVAVNSAGTALEFINKIDTFLELTDTPSAFTGAAGQYLRVNSGTSALEFTAAPTFLNLPDTPVSYIGQAGKMAVVNSGETGLEFVTPSSGGSGTGPNSARFRVDFAGSSGGNFIQTISQIPAGWTVVASGTNNATVTITMPTAAPIVAVVSYGWFPDPTNGDSYQRRNLDTFLRIPVLDSTSFRLVTMSASVLGSSASQHAYIEVLTR